jgi:hypothetical protein
MLLNILADQAAELDEIVDAALPLVRARVSVLLANPLERDDDVWSQYSEDIELVPEDFAIIPRQDKDDEWAARLAAFVLAAQMQAFAELVARDVLRASESHGESANPAAEKLGRQELRAAAKVGISKTAVATAAEKRRAAKALA